MHTTLIMIFSKVITKMYLAVKYIPSFSIFPLILEAQPLKWKRKKQSVTRQTKGTFLCGTTSPSGGTYGER